MNHARITVLVRLPRGEQGKRASLFVEEYRQLSSAKTSMAS